MEISGWGKIKFNRKKAIKHYEKLLSKKEIFSNKLENAITEKEKNSYITKLNNTIAVGFVSDRRKRRKNSILGI